MVKKNEIYNTNGIIFGPNSFKKLSAATRVDKLRHTVTISRAASIICFALIFVLSIITDINTSNSDSRGLGGAFVSLFLLPPSIIFMMVAIFSNKKLQTIKAKKAKRA